MESRSSSSKGRPFCAVLLSHGHLHAQWRILVRARSSCLCVGALFEIVRPLPFSPRTLTASPSRNSTSRPATGPAIFSLVSAEAAPPGDRMCV